MFDVIEAFVLDFEIIKLGERRIGCGMPFPLKLL